MAIAIAASGFVATAYAFHIFGLGAPSCATNRPKATNTVYFTIIMSSQGYNGSVTHPLPWPIMNVTQGQTVKIHVVNNDPSEPHGFVINHYFPTGVPGGGLKPGTCYDVTFTADQLGTFTVFCNIFCAIHIPWMQNGQLNVNR